MKNPSINDTVVHNSTNLDFTRENIKSSSRKAYANVIIKIPHALATLCSPTIPHPAFYHLFCAGRLRMAIFKRKKKRRRKKGTSCAREEVEGRESEENGKSTEWKVERVRKEGREVQICKVTVDPVLFECKSHVSRPALYANARLFMREARRARAACSCATQDATAANSDRRKTLVVGVVNQEEKS